MGMNVLAAGVVLLSAYIWLTRGFFSAFIHLMCVVAAGAVALAVWEPLAYLILDKAPADTTFFGRLLVGSAWGIAMAVPFALTLAVLRLSVDSMLRRNVKLTSAANYAGGAICGALSGVIVSGIAVMSIGFLRLPTDMSFMDYNPVVFDGQGSVKKNTKLWVPTDVMTQWFYSQASAGSFASSESLKKWYPDLYMVPGTMRYNANKGASKNTIRKNQFDVVTSYQIAKAPLAELVKDQWRKTGQGGVVDVNGEAFNGTPSLYGFVVNFKGEAKEKASGQVIVGNALIRLVSQNEKGESTTSFPFAVLANYQLSADDLLLRKDKGPPIRPTRFIFTSGGDGTFIPSVGGAAEAKFGFEFIVPDGYKPVALYVKNVRTKITGEPQLKFPSYTARDSAIDRIMSGQGARQYKEDPTMMVIGNGRSDKPLETVPLESHFFISNSIGAGAGSLPLGKDSVDQYFTIVPRAGRNQSWAIANGEHQFDPQELQGNAGLDQNLRVDSYAAGDGVLVCQFDISLKAENAPWNPLGIGTRNLPRDQPISVVDVDGTAYDAIGYMYRDNQKVKLRYTPDKPLKGLEELETIDSSVSGQRCVLIFRVTADVVVNRIAIGDQVLVKWSPPFQAKGRQQ